MSETVKNIKTTAWEWRIACFWFLLFSLNSLCTSIMASLVNANWTDMDRQSKFLMIIAVMGNWTGTIMAFISQQAKRIQKTGLPFPTGDDTGFISRKDTVTQTVEVAKSPTQENK